MTKYLLYKTAESKHLFRVPETALEDLRFLLSLSGLRGFTARLLNRRQFKEEGSHSPFRVFSNIIAYWKALEGL